MFDFRGKVVLITGATGNLGSAAALAFADAGASLALHGRSMEKLTDHFSERIRLADHHLVTGSLLDEKEFFNAAEEVAERFGKIDILVNAVGGYRAGEAVHESSLQSWDAMMDLNARSAFVAAKTVAAVMIRQRSGKMILVASRTGMMSKGKDAAYSASKSAVLRLVESMSYELREEGINVNCIVPGTIDTPQNRQAMPGADFKKWVSPTSLSGVILFLASELARDIHGAAIPIYGRS